MKPTLDVAMLPVNVMPCHSTKHMNGTTAIVYYFLQHFRKNIFSLHNIGVKTNLIYPSFTCKSASRVSFSAGLKSAAILVTMDKTITNGEGVRVRKFEIKTESRALISLK